jgi:hypothetical protein
VLYIKVNGKMMIVRAFGLYEYQAGLQDRRD